MSNNEKYGVKITPVPEIASGGVKWGWKAELQDLRGGDEKYNFSEGALYDTADAAANSGAKALRAYVNALKEVNIYTVDLDAPDPVEEPQVEVAQESTDAAEASTEEKPATEETPAPEAPAAE